MLAFIEMLVGPAEKAGIKIPEDVNHYNPNDYPHFHVYANLQLGASMPTPTSHWSNAEVVAAVPEDKIKTILLTELVALGFQIGYPTL